MCCRSGKDDEDSDDDEEEVVGKDGKKTKKKGKKGKKKASKPIEVKFEDTGVNSIDEFCKTVQAVLDQFKTITSTLSEQKTKFLEATGF